MLGKLLGFGCMHEKKPFFKRKLILDFLKLKKIETFWKKSSILILDLNLTV